DDGASWTPLLHFRDVRGPLPCGDLPAVCAGPWAAAQGLFNPGHSAGDDGGAPATPAGPPHRGCGCAVGGAAPPSAPIGLLLSVFLSCLLMSLTNGKKEIP